MKKALIGVWFLIAGLAQAAELSREPENLFDLIKNFNASTGRSHPDQYKVYYEKYKLQVNMVVIKGEIKYYPLSLAIKKKDPEIIAELVKRGAHVDGFLPYDAKSMRLLLRAGANPNACCQIGACIDACEFYCVEKIANRAVYSSPIEVFKELVKGGAETSSPLREAKSWESDLLSDISQFTEPNNAEDLEDCLQDLKFAQEKISFLEEVNERKKNAWRNLKGSGCLGIPALPIVKKAFCDASSAPTNHDLFKRGIKRVREDDLK